MAGSGSNKKRRSISSISYRIYYQPATASIGLEAKVGNSPELVVPAEKLEDEILILDVLIVRSAVVIIVVVHETDAGFR